MLKSLLAGLSLPTTNGTADRGADNEKDGEPRGPPGGSRGPCRVGGCSPTFWPPSEVALECRCETPSKEPQQKTPFLCYPDEAAAGSLPLVSVSLFTLLTPAEMAPYMKRLSRGQTVEGNGVVGRRLFLHAGCVAFGHGG